MENKKMSLWKQCRPFLAGLQLPLLVAVVAAVCSSIITVYGPTDPGLIGGYGKNQMVCRAPRENLINLNSQAVLEKLSSL